MAPVGAVVTLAKSWGRALGLAGRGRHPAHEQEGLGVARLATQDLATDRGRLDGVAGLVMMGGLGEPVVGGLLGERCGGLAELGEGGHGATEPMTMAGARLGPRPAAPGA